MIVDLLFPIYWNVGRVDYMPYGGDKPRSHGGHGGSVTRHGPDDTPLHRATRRDEIVKKLVAAAEDGAKARELRLAQEAGKKAMRDTMRAGQRAIEAAKPKCQFNEYGVCTVCGFEWPAGRPSLSRVHYCNDPSLAAVPAPEAVAAPGPVADVGTGAGTGSSDDQDTISTILGGGAQGERPILLPSDRLWSFRS